MMKSVELNQLLEQIEAAFGAELPFSGRKLMEQELETLGHIFGEKGYQSYLQDQVNRQIIRDYLANAVVLGHLPQQDLETFALRVTTPSQRSCLSLHMLMNSVEKAPELLRDRSDEALKALQPGPESPPHIRLIQS